MEFIKMVLFCLCAAVGYGILHDQITAHLCVEYFSIAHPPVFPTQSPILLALGWGIIATWWVGLPLGVLAGWAARIGARHKLGLKEIRPLIFRLLIVMGGSAFLSGITGAVLVASGHQALLDGWTQIIPREKWVYFSADQWAHLASYLVGILGGTIVIAIIVYRRIRPLQASG